MFIAIAAIPAYIPQFIILPLLWAFKILCILNSIDLVLRAPVPSTPSHSQKILYISKRNLTYVFRTNGRGEESSILMKPILPVEHKVGTLPGSYRDLAKDFIDFATQKNGRNTWPEPEISGLLSGNVLGQPSSPPKCVNPSKKLSPLFCQSYHSHRVCRRTQKRVSI